MPMFFSGSINRNQFERQNRGEVQRQLDQVKDFRLQLIGHILADCDEPMLITAVIKYQVYYEQAQAAADELKQKMPELAAVPLAERNSIYYARVKAALTTFFRFGENPLACNYKDALCAEYEMLQVMVGGDPKIQQMLP